MALDSEDHGNAAYIARLIRASLIPRMRESIDAARKDRRRYTEYVLGDGDWAILNLGKGSALPVKEALLPRSLCCEERACQMANMLNAAQHLKTRGQHMDLEDDHYRQLAEYDEDFRIAYLCYKARGHFGDPITEGEDLDQAV